MTRKTSRILRRWSEGQQTVRPADETAAGRRTPAAYDPRDRRTGPGLGPYESSYDISNGYGTDRTITLIR